MSKNDGGPAFPVNPDGPLIPNCNDPNENPQREFPGHSGMTLRDYFAGQVMAAIVSDKSVNSNGDPAGSVARISYAFADAMIAERDKP